MKKIVWVGATILAILAFLINSVVQLLAVVVAVALGGPDSEEWIVWLFVALSITVYFGCAYVFCRTFAGQIAKQAIAELDQ